MTLRLTAEQDHALTLLASAQGTSKHEAVVRAVVAAAARTLADAHVDTLTAPLAARPPTAASPPPVLPPGTPQQSAPQSRPQQSPHP